MNKFPGDADELKGPHWETLLLSNLWTSEAGVRERESGTESGERERQRKGKDGGRKGKRKVEIKLIGSSGDEGRGEKVNSGISLLLNICLYLSG